MDWPEHFEGQIFGRHEDTLDQLRTDAERLTESPIEAMFAVALVTAGSTRQFACFLSTVEGLKIHHMRANFLSGIFVRPQLVVGEYRVDFAIDAFLFNEHCQLVVECDGHDFHEKTKEQARKDKSRDRNLQQLGLPVFRFTGSEIYADALTCADQIITHCMDECLRLSDKRIEIERQIVKGDH